jgi:hypothetical protein
MSFIESANDSGERLRRLEIDDRMHHGTHQNDISDDNIYLYL